MTRCLLVTGLFALAITLAGCGGGSPLAPGPAPPTADGGDLVQVGPMLVRPASAVGFSVEPLRITSGCAFIALWGSQIDYLASQALLDRIVFTSSRDGYSDLWACNLDGSGLTQLTDNAADEYRAQWSPDGARIVFDRRWATADSELIVMDADGSSIVALTDNDQHDTSGTWSPDGRRIAFESYRTLNWEIYTMYADGSDPQYLAATTAAERWPDWSHSSDPLICFSSDRAGGNYEIYTVRADDTGLSTVTNTSGNEYHPAWHPNGYLIGFDRQVGTGDHDILDINEGGSNERRLSNHPGNDRNPAWSSDGRWFAFDSHRAGNYDIWLQDTEEPYRAYRVTTHAATDEQPHLGSPTMQTERALIGPPGSDWGGLDPIWSSAYAGVCVFDDDGYRNFVRIGIYAGDLGSLEVTPLMVTSPSTSSPVGVLVEANEIVNLREDAGRGEEPTVWDLDPLDAGAAVLYFDPMSGKLVSVLAVDDASYPAATGAPVVSVAAGGGVVTVAGVFSAVFDAQGRNLAPAGAARVALGDGGDISVLQ